MPHLALYVTVGPHLTGLHELTAVAGLLWTIEECLQSPKGEIGLRWYRHMTAIDARLGLLGGIARLFEGNADRPGSLQTEDRAIRRLSEAAARRR